MKAHDFSCIEDPDLYVTVKILKYFKLVFIFVRDNILWGQPYQKELYDAAVECCALNDDFCILPHGDLTEVGENGVTLSGGQKARVALARAVYQVSESEFVVLV